MTNLDTLVLLQDKITFVTDEVCGCDRVISETLLNARTSEMFSGADDKRWK